MDKIVKISEGEINSDNLILLYDELNKITSSNSVNKYEKEIKLILETIVEFLLTGEKKDQSIFDIFCEYNFMGEFLMLSDSGNSFINLQIIRNFSLLIPNILNKQSLYYIFSNNFINQIISNYDHTKRKNNGDEVDFLSYYVNFIKSISLKLDVTTIQFFFHSQLNSFPLLDNTLILYSYPDQMIRNVSRNILLSIIKMNYPPVIEYLCSLPQVTYFIFYAKNLCDTINFLIEKKGSKVEIDVIRDINDNIINDIIFIQDVFKVGNAKINYIFTNCIFNILIISFLCGNIVKGKNEEISLFIIWEIFLYMKDENFINLLTFILYNENLPNKLNDLCKMGDKYNDIVYLKNTITNLSFENYIKFNFNDNFFKSFPFIHNSPYKEIKYIQDSYNEKFKDKEDDNILKSILIELIKVINKKSILSKLEKYHTYISRVTGIRYGLSYNGQKNSVMQLISKMLLSKLSDNKKNKNIIKEKILSLFNTEASSERYIFLYNLLILYQIEIGNKTISKDLLYFINYGTFPNVNVVNKEGNFFFFDINSYENIEMPNSLKEKEVDLNNYITYKENFAKKHNFDEYYTISFPNSFFSIIINQSQINPINKESNNMSLTILLFFSLISTNTINMSNLCLKIIMALINETKDKKKYSQLINEGYINAIYQLKNKLNKEKNNYTSQLFKFSFEFFEKELIFYKTSLEPFLSSIAKDPCFINSKYIGQIIPEYVICPKNDINIFKYLLNKFFGFYDLRILTNGMKSPQIKNSDNILKFSGNPININTEVNLNELQIEHHELIYKDTNDNNPYEYSMFFNQNFIYFSERSKTNKNLFYIKKQFSLRRIDSTIDNTNRKNVFVFVLGEKGYNIKILTCKDFEKADEINMLILNMKGNAILLELILVDSYFTDLIMKYQSEQQQ